MAVVRTPSGAEHFGQPIGTVIKKDRMKGILGFLRGGRPAPADAPRHPDRDREAAAAKDVVRMMRETGARRGSKIPPVVAQPPTKDPDEKLAMSLGVNFNASNVFEQLEDLAKDPRLDLASAKRIQALRRRLTDGRW